MIQNLTLTGSEFSQLVRGFMGGHTHANAHHVDKVLTNVASYDFKSSYPAVMVLEKFPMSKPYHLDEEISKQDFLYLLETRCCLFDATFTNLVPKLHFEHPLSKSKCRNLKGKVFEKARKSPLDNGRLISAEQLTVTLTELDYDTINRFYKWDTMTISNFMYFDKAYLPKNFVLSVLKLFGDKTTLDGIPEEAVNYMIAKGMLNSCYGMIVTNPCRDQFTYGHDATIKDVPDLDSAIEKYNNSVRRFLYYPWGVWVTAYARHNLFSGILECANDFVYCDTDSIYLLNHDLHKPYFEDYNQRIRYKIEAAADYHKIDKSLFSPLNPAGHETVIGIWEYQGDYDEFKTLGAKRYLYRQGDEYHLTLSGANKKTTLKYLESLGNPFDYFTNELTIPREFSGRNTVTYLDTPFSGTTVDYMGNKFSFTELSGVHMESSEYKMTMADDYINYLMHIKEIAPV